MISATAMRVTSVRSPNWDQPIRRHHPLEKSGWLEVGRRDDLYIFFHLKIKPRVTLFRGRSIGPFFGPARQVVGSDSGTDACFFFFNWQRSGGKVFWFPRYRTFGFNRGICLIFGFVCICFSLKSLFGVAFLLKRGFETLRLSEIRKGEGIELVLP